MNDYMFSKVIVFVPVVIFINSIPCGFVFDDKPAIVNNKDVRGETPITDLLYNDFWGTSIIKETSHKSYRPFTVFTFRLNYLIFGETPWAYHMVNAVLHALVCLLVYGLYKHITLTQLQSFDSERKKISKQEVCVCQLASLLFAVHPIHVEAVTGLVGRAEVLSTIFFILAIFCYLKITFKSLFASFFFCGLAMFSKEQGITVLGVCLVIDIFLINQLTLSDFCFLIIMSVKSPKQIRYKSLFLRILAVFFCGMFLIFIRFSVMQSSMPFFNVFDNPSSMASFPSRQLTLNYLLPVNVWLFLSPCYLLCDWTMGTIPLVTSVMDFRNLASLFFWISFVSIGIYSCCGRQNSCKLALFGVALGSFSFLPASNLLFNVGFVVAERVLYTPSIGLCFLFAIGVGKLRYILKSDQVLNGFILFLFVTHAVKAIRRNCDWKNDRVLFRSALKITQRNAKVWNNVGHTYESENKWKEALKYFMQAATVQPDDIGSLMNVGRMYEELEQFKEAENIYWKAKELFPKSNGLSNQARVVQSHLNLYLRLAAIIKADSNRLEEADKLYRELIHMRKFYVIAYIKRGELLIQLKNYHEALNMYHQALQYSENKSDIFFNIGVIHNSMGNKTGALEGYTYAIYHNPLHVKALFNSATILQETLDKDLLQRAKLRVERVLSLEPDNNSAHTLLGSIHMDLNNTKQALDCWNLVLNNIPNDKTCLFNKAFLLYKLDGHTMACIETINTLLSFHPQHVKGLLLYGDIMLNRLKDIQQAQKAFKNVTEIEPTNVQGQHNLCVTIVRSGDWKKAEKCLQHVVQLAPQETHVAENLAIVRRNLAKNEAYQLQVKGEKDFQFTQKVEEEHVSANPPDLNKKTSNCHEPNGFDRRNDEVYVAGPLKRPMSSFVQQASKVIKNLNRGLKSQSEVEHKMAQASRALDRLKRIHGQSEQKVRKQCGKLTKKETADSEDLRRRALEVLTDLDAQLT